MAQIFPLPGTLRGGRAAPAPAIYGYETRGPRGRRLRGILALVRLHPLEDGMIVAAQSPPAHIEDGPAAATMLYDEPACILDDLVFATTPEELPGGALLYALRDPHSLNIVCTGFQEKRLILAGNDSLYYAALARRTEAKAPARVEEKVNTMPIHPHGYLHLRPERPEDAVPVLLLNEESGNFSIEAMHQTSPIPATFDRALLLDHLRLFFHIEHLPGVLTAARVEYLLTHGNELGAAFIVAIAAAAYLLKARLDVIAALVPERAPADCFILDLVLQRFLPGNSAQPALFAEAIAHAQSARKLVFFLNPPSLFEIQYAALHREPLPRDVFLIAPQVPSGTIHYPAAQGDA